MLILNRTPFHFSAEVDGDQDFDSSKNPAKTNPWLLKMIILVGVVIVYSTVNIMILCAIILTMKCANLSLISEYVIS